MIKKETFEKLKGNELLLILEALYESAQLHNNSLDDFFLYLKEGNLKLYTYRIDGILIAYCLLNKNYIYHMYVVKKYRNKGIAFILFDYLPKRTEWHCTTTNKAINKVSKKFADSILIKHFYSLNKNAFFYKKK